LSSKIHATVDALGNPTSFALTPGQTHDLEGADLLLPAIQADTVIADKAYDADQRVIRPLELAGKTFVIPPRSNRNNPRVYDRELYKARHLIENFFAKLKQFRGIATRYDKTARNFLAAIYLVASVIWLN
jgi:transposase